MPNLNLVAVFSQGGKPFLQIIRQQRQSKKIFGRMIVVRGAGLLKSLVPFAFVIGSAAEPG